MKMNRTVLMIVATLLAGLSPLVTLAADAVWPHFLGPGSRHFPPTPICRRLVRHGERGLENADSGTRLVVAHRVGRPRVP